MLGPCGPLSGEALSVFPLLLNLMASVWSEVLLTCSRFPLFSDPSPGHQPTPTTWPLVRFSGLCWLLSHRCWSSLPAGCMLNCSGHGLNPLCF